jgi:hypothetical protein
MHDWFSCSTFDAHQIVLVQHSSQERVMFWVGMTGAHETSRVINAPVFQQGEGGGGLGHQSGGDNRLSPKGVAVSQPLVVHIQGDVRRFKPLFEQGDWGGARRDLASGGSGQLSSPDYDHLFCSNDRDRTCRCG